METIGRKTLPISGLFVAIAVVTGCATSPSEGGQAARQNISTASDCILSRTIRDFSTLDDQNLIIDGPGSRSYHVVLTTPSLNLRSEFTIGIVDRDGDGRVCPFGRDRILIDGPIREQMSIRSIEAIDDADVEALRIQFGITEPAPEDTVTVTDIEPDE